MQMQGLIRRRRVPPWVPHEGETVELRRYWVRFRTGTVETVMPDGSGFWVEASGADRRQYVHIGDEDIQIFA
jgi:hypothetical protein